MSIPGPSERYSLPSQVVQTSSTNHPVSDTPATEAAVPAEAVETTPQEIQGDSIEGVDNHRCFEFSRQIQFGTDNTVDSAQSTEDIQDFDSLLQEVEIFNEALEILHNEGDPEKAEWFLNLIADSNPWAAQKAENIRLQLQR